MRLTLRTLLAYLDDILDEQDAQELRKKIEESELATQLSHRIRQLVAQPHVRAVAPDAPGPADDANMVAEYLDNTLPLDQVPDFERLTLEADARLSEVAACHQILALVLGQPADIPAGLKARVYALPSQQAHLASTIASAVDEGNVSGAPTTEPVEQRVELPGSSPAKQRMLDPGPPRDKDSRRDADERWTEAPDYLKRHRRRQRLRVATAAALGVCLLAFAAVAMFGPWDVVGPLARLISGASPESGEQLSGEPPADQGPLGQPSPTDQEATLAEPSGNGQTPPANAITSTDTDRADGSRPSPVAEEPTATSGATGRQPSNQPTSNQPTSDRLPIGPSTVQPTAPPGPPATDLATSSPPPDTDLPPPTVAPTLVDPLRRDERPPALPQPELPGTAPGNSENLTPQGTDAAQVEPGPIEIGRFASDDQILVRVDPSNGIPAALRTREPVRVGDRLVALPVFRPEVLLASGTQVVLVGPTTVDLLEPTQPDTPHLQLLDGRLQLLTFAQNGSTVELTWNDRRASVQLANIDSRVAIELRRRHLPGADPTDTPAHVVLLVVPIEGEIVWREPDQPEMQLTSGQTLTSVDHYPTFVESGTEPPEWIDGGDLNPRDPLAARGLAEQLDLDRPLLITLRELAESPRLEVRSLAAISLAYLGDYDALLASLREERLRSYWSDQFKMLRHLVAQSPERASQVQTAIEMVHPTEGDDLYRMLWGFSQRQLEQGAADQLVQWLDHQSSDFRVAAIENLKEITGTPSLYLPHMTEKQRRSAVIRWKNRAAKGEIRYRKPPEIIMLLDKVRPPLTSESVPQPPKATGEGPVDGNDAL